MSLSVVNLFIENVGRIDTQDLSDLVITNL